MNQSCLTLAACLALGAPCAAAAKRLAVACEAEASLAALRYGVADDDASGNKKCYRYHGIKEYDDCKHRKVHAIGIAWGEKVKTSIDRTGNLFFMTLLRLIVMVGACAAGREIPAGLEA